MSLKPYIALCNRIQFRSQESLVTQEFIYSYGKQKFSIAFTKAWQKSLYSTK